MARTKRTRSTTKTSQVSEVQLRQDSESDDDDEEHEEEEEEKEQEEDKKKQDNNSNKKKRSSPDETMKSRKRQNTRRGPGYSSEETDILLSSIQEVLPIGPLDWEQVVRLHTDHFPGMGRDLQSIHRKFNKLQASRIPTGDPNCPPAVRRAKRIH